MAVNCSEPPLVMLGLDGVTTIEERVGTGTVSVVLAEILPNDAEIADEPGEMAVACPAAFMVATLVFAEPQVTMVVRSALVLSEYIPVALNCCVVLLGMLGVIGVITREVRVLDDTVSVVLFDIIPDVAVMVEAPAEKPVASPSSLIVATDVFEELHETADVISPWVLFE